MRGLRLQTYYSIDSPFADLVGVAGNFIDKVIHGGAPQDGFEGFSFSWHTLSCKGLELLVAGNFVYYQCVVVAGTRCCVVRLTS